MTSRRTLLGCMLSAALVLAACAAKAPKPVAVKALISASADVNPDSAGRASPIVVRVFQLRGDAEFSGADFFALYDREKETLGASLIVREEYVLQPGEQKQLDLPVSQEARFVGAIAAFRDIQTARWRALAPAPAKSLSNVLRKDKVTLTVDKSTIKVSVKD